MTKPKQAQKTLSENTGKTFSVIMPPFSSKGGAQLRCSVRLLLSLKKREQVKFSQVSHSMRLRANLL